ncbi:MAG: carbohydrate-binding protein [Actinobacteria bacterium]|nr:MAG: carbohydrate-binding protein [Actinomycetota bacterium]
MSTWLRGLLAVTLAVPVVVVTTASGAGAQDNGVGRTPLLGWSSWSFIRKAPTAAKIEAQADAVRGSGLADAGFRYVNVDDFWYQCPGSQGPNVDGFGRWVTDPVKFPPDGATDGIQVVADHVHGDGLKFGLYVTPGIAKQAVAQNTPIEGTPYHAADIATTTAEKNYNCKGMVGIDYTRPGAQEFVNSWANEFASWGVDYVKIDGVGTSDVPDIQAWSNALRQTGRPIHLELSNSLSITAAPTWQRYANGWRTGGDIECYSCEPAGSSYPLTSWGSVRSRFNQVAAWQPYGAPGGFNDYDSIEVGNGSNDGLTVDERKAQMSLWALAASPFILGTDLTNLDAGDLALLKNTRVLAVDQDAIDAKRIVSNVNQQVYSKTEANGDVIIGLFNYSDTASQTDTVDLSSAGITGSATATDVWSGASLGTISGTYSVTLNPGAVQLIRATPTGGGSGGSFEAESAANTLAGGAKVASCTACSGGQKVGFVGNGATLTFNNVTVASTGRYAVAIAYGDGSTTGRQAVVSVNGGPGQTIQFTPTGGFSTPGTMTVTLTLTAGTNTIQFGNPTAYAPDFDKITVPASPIATGYEAESASNTLAGGAKVASCTACSGGQKVGFVGNGATLTFNGVNVSVAGSYPVAIAYCDGSTTGRQAVVSVNGGAGQTLTFTPTGGFSTPGTMTVTLTLAAGTNTFQFGNPTAYAPDFDKVSVTG